MSYAEQFAVKEGARIRLSEIDPNFVDANEDKKSARKKVQKLAQHLDELQFKLYAGQKRSLLICLQAMDAGGKDGTIRCIGGAMNPQGCRVVPFKQPSIEERAHDFLWRVEKQTPQRGEVVIFNRSHYEDVLVVRVHNVVPKKTWSQRYAQINDFERRLAANDTQVLKFFLHISKEEQLERYHDRLEDPARRWKISESDYSEREFWSDYHSAYEDAINRCTTTAAPWFVIPANHKWFRNLAISSIVVETLERMKLVTPKPTVDVKDIRQKYHAAREAERAG